MTQQAPARPATGAGSKQRGMTRALLLDAGFNLFAQKGFDGVAVSDLEEAVGLKAGSGSFYRHFADKEALLKAILEREIDNAQQRRASEQVDVVNLATDIRSALATQFKRTLTGLRDNAERASLLQRGADHFPELKRALRRHLVKDGITAVAEVFALRMQQGDLVQADPLALARVVQSALYGYVTAESTFGRAENPQAMDDALVDTLVTLLVRDGGQPAASASTGTTAKKSGKTSGASR